MVPPASHRISRVPRYSGTDYLSSPSLTRLSLSLVPLSRSFRSAIVRCRRPTTPRVRRLAVWPLSFSLATTKEIEFSFFSSGYLDVSLPRVPLLDLWIQSTVTGHYPSRVPPFGNLRINAYLRLPSAYRSLSRPSSAISALASTLRSCSLDLASSRRSPPPKTLERIPQTTVFILPRLISRFLDTRRLEFDFLTLLQLSL